MTYHSGKVGKRRKYLQYGAYTVLFFSIVIFWPFIKKNVYQVLEPAVLGYADTKGVASIFPEFLTTYITSHKTLAEKNNLLILDVERLENKVAELDAIVREHQDVPFSEDSTSTVIIGMARAIVAYPLAGDLTSLYSTIRLSKGYKEGVTVDSLVYVRGRQVVCIIKEVSTNTSLCSLLSSQGIVTEGVTSSSSITLSLVGRGGHYLSDVARDTPITVGEKVYLRSDQSMSLGTVTYIANNNQDTSWHVFVEGGYNPVKSSVFYVQP